MFSQDHSGKIFKCFREVIRMRTEKRIWDMAAKRLLINLERTMSIAR